MSVAPELDIAPFLAGSQTDKMLLAKELDAVCRDAGFFCLTGHGVSDEDFREIYDVSKAFFHLDVEEKHRVAQCTPDVIRGYIGVGAAALGGLQGEETPSDWICTTRIIRVPLRADILPQTNGPNDPRNLVVSGRNIMLQ